MSKQTQQNEDLFLDNAIRALKTKQEIAGPQSFPGEYATPPKGWMK